MSGSVTITLYQLSENSKGLNPSDGAKHKAKVVKCDVDCPYFIPDPIWHTEANNIVFSVLMTQRCLNYPCTSV